MSTTTTLITGGAGFIGSHVAEALVARGDRVLVLDDLSTGSRGNLPADPHIEFVEGSIADTDLLSDVVARVQAVYHLAAAVGVSFVTQFPIETVERNIHPTEQLLRLASERRVKVFLASSSEVYGKGSAQRMHEDDDMVLGSPAKTRYIYALTKLIDEYLALAYHRQRGLPVVVGRFFNVVGPRQSGRYGMVIPRFVSQGLGGGPIEVHDDGNQVRCFMHVRDAVRAIIELMRTPAAVGRIVNVGSDAAVTIRQLADRVAALLGRDVPVRHIPYSSVYAPGFEDVRCRIPDLSRLRELIGFEPRFGLDDILREVIAHERGGGTAA